MTTPDSRPVLDVIADVVEDVLDVYDTVMHVHSEAQAIAAAVLAACQGATVAQRAELTKGRVEHARFTRLKLDGRFGQVPVSRAVTEWREDPS